VSFHTPTQFIWVAANLIICGLALWRGGWPERIVALGSLIASRATPLVENFHNWVDPQWGVFGVDVTFFALLLILALRTDRTWLLFAAAFQLLAVITHLAIMVDPGLRARVYMSAILIWSYCVLASLAVGTWLVSRRPRPAT
jgi:hypothetical protein